MSARVLCNTTAKTRTAVPVRTPRVASETAKLSAWEAPTPEAIRAAAPAPTCVAAPPDRSGARPLLRRRKERRARVGVSSRSRAHPRARRPHLRGRASRRARGRTLATRAVARSCAGSASGRAGSANSACLRRRVAARRLLRRPPHRRPQRPPVLRARHFRVSGNGSCKSKRRQGDAVDQAEHDEREAEHAHAGRTGSCSGGRRRFASRRRSGQEAQRRSGRRRRWRPRARGAWAAPPL